MKTRRMLCLLLTVVMLLTWIPVPALAAEVGTEAEEEVLTQTTETVVEENVNQDEEVYLEEELPQDDVTLEEENDIPAQMVEFFCQPDGVLLTVFDADGAVVSSDEDNSLVYWLLPGTYRYEAMCEGFETTAQEFDVYDEPVSVTVTLKVIEAAEEIEVTETTEAAETEETNAPENTEEVISEAAEEIIPETSEETIPEDADEDYWEYTNEFGQTISISGCRKVESNGPKMRASDPNYYTPTYSVEEAGDLVREYMVGRTHTFRLSYIDKTGSITDTAMCKEIINSIIDESVKHTGNPVEGDYLKFHYSHWSFSFSYSAYFVDMDITIDYFTDAGQEAEMNGAVSNVLARLDLSGKSSYEKTKAIYDYVCANVDYDYDNPGDYMLKYSAYAALVNGKAVCQGYANLMYRLLLEAGVNTRFISGTGNGGGHAWNIVNIGGLYYNIDATWDANTPPQYYQYFLRAPGFNSHTRNAEFETAAFHASYPMAPSDYIGENHEHTEVATPDKAPTCTKDGQTGGTHCSVCGEVITEATVVHALGHDLVAGEVIHPDCVNSGYTIYKCSRCDITEKRDETEPLGHDITEIVEVIAPTCEKEGYTVYKCVRCDVTENRDTVAATGHTEEIRNAQDATCTAPGYTGDTFCKVCNKKLASGTWFDSEGHDFQVSKVVEPTCTERGYTEYICSRCELTENRDYTNSLGHSFTTKASEKLASEATCSAPAAYFVQCDRCDVVSTTQTVSVGETIDHIPGEVKFEKRKLATCDTDGQHDEVVYCTACNAELNRETVIDEKLGHDFSEEYRTYAPGCEGPGYTKYKCTRCEEMEERDFVPALGHDFSVKKTTVAPTCTEDGYTTYRCSRCIKTENRDIVKATGHIDEIRGVKEATCTEDGYTGDVYCKTCGIFLRNGEVIKALDHVFTEKVEIVEPTCTTQGYTVYKCPGCNATENRDFTTPVAHTAEVRDAKSATCTEPGYTGDSYCKFCDVLMGTGEEIDPLGHNFKAGEVVAPTCTKDGYTIYNCSRCDATENRDQTAALGHVEEIRNTKSATCETAGYTGDTYCKTCDMKLESGKAISALGHDYSVETETVAPTCTEKGYTTYKCSRCDKTENRDFVNPTGHSFNEKASDVLAKDATCTEAAVHFVICDNCDEVSPTRTVSVGAPKGHTPGEAVRENEKGSTCTEAGSYDEAIYCVVCHAELSRKAVIGEILGHNYSEFVKNVAPTCTEQGYTVYKCVRCNETENRDFVDPVGHSEEIRNAKPATCEAAGYTGDTYCSVCDTLIEKGTEIPAIGHSMTHTDAKDATCTEAGNVEYWTCGICSKMFSDSDGKTEITDTIIPAQNHKLTKIDAKEPTTSAPGNIEHWACSVCQKLFNDDKASKELTLEEVIIPKLSSSPTILNLSGTELAGTKTIWVDGRRYTVTDDVVDLGTTTRKVLTVYTYKNNGGDRHKDYPTGMKVYFLKSTKAGYTITRIDGLKDILKYFGCSVRITGKKGIRMISGMPESMRDKLINSNIEGYHLEEYGTVLEFASKVDANGGNLTLENGKSNYAYRKGGSDAIFSKDSGTIQYTNVLVGFTLDQCKEDIAMRPYVILKNEKGESVTIYGGIVYRSVGYVAFQNKDTFPKGSEGYNYIWDIIAATYGDDLPV